MGVVIIAREGAAGRKKAVPFGIFLALGGIVGVLAGPELIDLYESDFPRLTPRVSSRSVQHPWTFSGGR